MMEMFESSYEPGRRDTLIRRLKVALIGLVAVSSATLAIREGIHKFNEIMSEYESRQKTPVSTPSDEEQVRRFISESKNRDPKTGKARLVYKLSGAMAVQHHAYENDGLQPTSITNFVLVKLHNNRTYLYGENALADPKIFRLDQAVVCALNDVTVRLEEVVLDHNPSGGIGLKDTGHFLSNDSNWQEKCQSYILAEHIVISAEI